MRMIQSQEPSPLLQHILHSPIFRFQDYSMLEWVKMGLAVEKTSDLKRFARLRLTERGSKEEPMSEYRRDDTASWDAQEVLRAQ